MFCCGSGLIRRKPKILMVTVHAFCFRVDVGAVLSCLCDRRGCSLVVPSVARSTWYWFYSSRTSTNSVQTNFMSRFECRPCPVPPPRKAHYFIFRSSSWHIVEMTSTHGKPSEGMCCLCTMEDITEEDGNYGTIGCAFSRKQWSIVV